MKIEGKKILKKYKMGKVSVLALNDVDFLVQEHEFNVIAGPSGSGKTTLLNICGLIDKPTSGRIYFDGEDVTDFSESKLTKLRREKIGFIFQSFNIIPVLSVYENVEYALDLLGVRRKEKKDKIEYYLNKVGLWHRRKHKSKELSGGERQRVSIARALVKEPELVVADEPTANLDSNTTREIIDLMKELFFNNKITFLIASHDPIVIEHGEKIINIRDGIIMEGK